MAFLLMLGMTVIPLSISAQADDLSPPDGTVKLKGEFWRATSEKRIRKGEEVVVKDVKGLVLIVEKRGKK